MNTVANIIKAIVLAPFYLAKAAILSAFAVLTVGIVLVAIAMYYNIDVEMLRPVIIGLYAIIVPLTAFGFYVQDQEKTVEQVVTNNAKRAAAGGAAFAVGALVGRYVGKK